MSWHSVEAGPVVLVRKGTAARAAREPTSGIARGGRAMGGPPVGSGRARGNTAVGGTMLQAPFHPGGRPRSPQESEGLAVGAEGLDHEGDVVLEIDAEEARPLRDLEALDLRGEGPVL